MPNIQLAALNKPVVASLNLPGSKSIANRVLPLAAIASGTSIIHNIPDVSDDVILMLQALEVLGVKISKINNSNNYPSYMIEGCGGGFRVKKATIFCGNSGTTIRFLGAILALCDGEYTLTGTERMNERPIKDMVAGLEQLGAQINYLENDGYPPLQLKQILDNKVENISLSGQISSQYLTGILMALPLLKRQIQVNIIDNLISKPYVDITLALLAKFGYKVSQLHNKISYLVAQVASLNAIEYTVEPDASSAGYFLAMGAINGKITINNLSANSLQGDKDFARVLQQMGAIVDYLPNAIQVRKHGLKAIKVDMQAMPDVAMTLAVVALFAKGTTTITGIASWKVKETDRLQAMHNELSKLGARVIITLDSISITPPEFIKPNMAIDTYNDHRMAMCFALIAVGGIPITINDYECVGKTFANYFDILHQISSKCYNW